MRSQREFFRGQDEDTESASQMKRWPTHPLTPLGPTLSPLENELRETTRSRNRERKKLKDTLRRVQRKNPPNSLIKWLGLDFLWEKRTDENQARYQNIGINPHRKCNNTNFR